jgi:hypothetical protein
MSRELAEALGIEHVEIDENIEIVEFFDNYVPWGGGGSGIKNGHYGCKHTEEAKRIMSEKKRGLIPWNKNVKGYSVHTEDSKRSMAEKLCGSNNGRAILCEIDVDHIIRLYLSRPNLDEVGKVQNNGKEMSYIWAFSKMIAEQYKTTPAAIKRLLQKKSWKHVWKKYELSNQD